MPQQRGKYQHLGKYEFTIPAKTLPTDPDTIVHFKIDTPADRYLLNYMRAKIVDRSANSGGGKDHTEAHNVICLNQLNLGDIRLSPNGVNGYCLIVEGVMPYNTTEG